MQFAAVAQPAQRHCIGEALESRQLLTVVSDVAVLSFDTAPDELAAEIGDGLATDTLRHDLNGDGVLDLIQPGDSVFIDQDLQLAQLKISYAATGSGDAWEQTFVFPGRVVDLDAGDINGDGHIDIGIGHRPQRGPLNGVSGGTSVLIGSESGFGPPLRISRVEPSRVAIFPASLDQQGEITLGKIVEIRGEDLPATMIQWSDETILPITDERVTGTHPTIVEDLDADGFSDVVSFVQNRNQIHVHVHASDTNAPITSEVGGTLSSPWNFITGDFNGDGTTDAFSWGFETTQTFLSNADFTFQAPLNERLPDTTHTIFTADYDGDGRDEIFFANGTLQLGTYKAYVGEFTAGAWQISREPKLDESAHAILVEDINRDGRDDIVVWDRIHYGTDEGIGNAALFDSHYWFVKPIDLDGDETYDLVGAPRLLSSIGASPPEVHVLTGGADGSFTHSRTIDTESAPSVLIVDLDNDALNDVVIASHDRSTQSSQYRFLLGDAAGAVAFDETTYPLSGDSPQRTWFVDINGDTYLDMVQSSDKTESLHGINPAAMLSITYGSPDGLDFSNTTSISIGLNAGNVRAIERVDTRLRVIVGHEDGFVILESDLRDLNQDGNVSADDIDTVCRLANSEATPSTDARFDFNSDQLVSLDDVDLFIDDVMRARRGDVDLDGDVDFDDFLQLATNYKSNASGWVSGDFTCDGRVNEDDFALLSENFGTSV